MFSTLPVASVVVVAVVASAAGVGAFGLLSLTPGVITRIIWVNITDKTAKSTGARMIQVGERLCKNRACLIHMGVLLLSGFGAEAFILSEVGEAFGSFAG